ncbi:MAG TPA: flagellar basal body protein [Terriglobales bacterium]|jgi:flagellar basal-body rod protein FlgB|nr:flagellar basal body protein [Terriglobales bacterium]
MSGIQLIEKYLNLATQRQQVTVNNMANVDTPGFRTRDFDFRNELENAVSTNASAASGPMLHPVVGLNARPDGNNVNLDREGLMLAEVQMQFKMGVQLIKSEFSRLLTAMKDGA